MIVNVLKQGNKQPVFTDPITSAVLKGVFNQKSVLFRRFTHSPFVYVEGVSGCNKPELKILPAGALVLLLEDKYQEVDSVRKIMVDYVSENLTQQTNGNPVGLQHNHPFRCVINVHGYTPTWVAGETGHWRPDLAETVYFYRYYNTRGTHLVSELRENPPENCYVFFCNTKISSLSSSSISLKSHHL